ncbi:MAG: 50S ribosomal protein L34e [archaeon]
MPRPSRRSRSLRRKQIVTPGGENRVRYLRRRAAYARCRSCSKPLRSLARSSEKRVPGSKRTLTRLYGGSVCPACLREALKQAVRSTT